MDRVIALPVKNTIIMRCMRNNNKIIKRRESNNNNETSNRTKYQETNKQAKYVQY